MIKTSVISLFILVLAACSDAPQSDLTKQQQDTGQGHKQAAIASAHPLATQAGLDILEKGGNAYDAAIATAAVLAVVEPYSAGMGGGGFWLLYDEATQQTRFIDAREKAPIAAHRDMYLDEDGNVIKNLSINGPMAAGIPGQAAAFAHIAKEYGNLPLSTSLAAAIQHAQNGFQIDRKYQILARWRLDALRDYPSAAQIFLQDNDVPDENHVVVQKDLAKTLTAIAKNGKAGFYEGPVAKQMVNSVQAAGGIWTLEDLKKYEVVERAPVTSEYRLANRQYKVTSAPPPSSGGIAIAQMFNMLEALEQHHEISWSELDGADEIHLLSEVMRRAYFDRAHYLGDSDFVDVPMKTLLDKKYAQKISKNVKLGKATKSSDLGTQQQIYEGFHTTHLSVIDQNGNRVSATLSINLPFGSAYLAEGTGLLLNNEMDDFSVKPGVPNAYGLVGNEANAIAPEKRPLSSMSPSFIETEDKVAIIGTPGGSRIITMVFLGMLEYIKGNPVKDWVSRPRFHHQYLPDLIQYEKDSLSLVEIASLKMKGHKLKEIQRQYGNMQAILWDKKNNELTAAADPRGVGSAEVRHIK